MFIPGNRTAKIPYDEKSTRQKNLTAKIPDGENSVRRNIRIANHSVRQKFRTTKNLTAKIPSAVTAVTQPDVAASWYVLNSPYYVHEPYRGNGSQFFQLISTSNNT